MIAEASEGIPRCINNLCFNSLCLGFAAQEHTIGPDIIREATADLDLTELGSESSDLQSRMLTADNFASAEAAVGARSRTFSPSPRDNETMTLEEALAVIQDTVRRMKNWQHWVKQTAS